MIRSTDKPLKVHLGCGTRKIPGFLHVDLMPLPHVDLLADVRDLRMIPDAAADLVYASHVLEHFGRHDYLAVLREWTRILRPGGTLRLAVPDFAACAALYYEQGLADGLTGLIGLICGGQRDERDFHRMIFDQNFLTASLHQVGITDVRRWDWRSTEHHDVDDYSQAYIPHLDKASGRLMSLNLEGVKGGNPAA
jgi:SAM-dependent methyltransferase